MHDLSLILLVGFGFGFALLFGLVTNKLGLSPIVGYLIAGIAVGPHTPGFVGDPALAAQLAEIGVILLMFGVGLHFNVGELLRVKGIALPGAIVQIGAAVLLSMFLVPLFGLPATTACVLGIAVSVASTVVLIRVLMDGGVLHTPQGHVAVGWLIVEDLFTVAVLVLLPTLGGARDGTAGGASILLSAGKAVLSIAAAVLVVLVLGRRVLPHLMNAVARTRSRELFTLAVLVVAMLVAVGSAKMFGVSMALGAFLAGLVVAQSDVGHQAAAEALPFRDAFAVLFFVSVGMLFDPGALVADPWLTAAVLGIVLVGKPLAAFVIVVLLNYPLRTALTVAIALAQIGEFSFILGDLARQLGYFDPSHSSVLVTCAIVSITLNPLVFRLVPRLERWFAALPGIGRFLHRRGRSDQLGSLSAVTAGPRRSSAIVVGYGPVGRAVMESLERADVPTTVVDLNVDTVRRLREQGRSAVYGDAQEPDLLEAAGAREAGYFVLTVPDPEVRTEAIEAARRLNPGIIILARSRYVGEEDMLRARGVASIVCEEAEVADELANRILEHVRLSRGVPGPGT